MCLKHSRIQYSFNHVCFGNNVSTGSKQRTIWRNIENLKYFHESVSYYAFTKAQVISKECCTLDVKQLAARKIMISKQA